MSAIDIRDAKGALAARLRMWNVDGAEAKAAEFVDQLVARGWRMDALREERPQPPKGDEACQLCGRHTDRCICDTGAPVWRPDAPATEEARRHWAKEARAALRPTTGEHA